MNDDHAKEEALSAPRKLGDQWENWNGTMEENNGDLDTNPGYFLGLSGLAILGVNLFSIFLLYMIEPRLASLHYLLHNGVFYTILGLLFLVDLSYVLVLGTVITGKPLAFFLKNKELANSSLIPLTVKIAVAIGFSKDRLINSMLKTSNTLTRALYPGVHPDDLLIIVPRCLSRFSRNELTALTEKYGITFYTAGGGNAARELLFTKKPKAIIAVACERDLLSGVQDVNGKIPVIAIANKRPEGPCKNTFINFDEMEDAICHFIKPKHHLDKKQSLDI